MYRSICLTLALWALVARASAALLAAGNTTQVCEDIGNKISSSSSVIYALDLNFLPDIHHWFYSSTQTPTCVLEAGSAQDVSAALKIIAAHKTPFAVYSGGHASNPTFSSTQGVHISFQKMKQVVLSNDKKTVEIGMGLTWTDVYKQLDGSGVNVVGGRVPGPGVGGFTLGGGFSWKTNQYGLTCDTVKSFTLVLPNGTISTVDSSYPDLFFALKGGQNRFGIVTSAVYFTNPQVPKIYGGLKFYDGKYTNRVLNATYVFERDNQDPKAQVITTINGGLTGSSTMAIFFYDRPNKPESFAPFDAIPALSNSVTTQSFYAFISSVPSLLAVNPRGRFHTMSTSSLTPGFVAAVKNETDTYGPLMALHSASVVSFDIEPFLSNYGKYATDSAYPHSDSPLPLNLYFAWSDPADDAFWTSTMTSIVSRLEEVAMSEGIYKADYTHYPNYAITGTTAQELYGSTNAQRLSNIREAVDPDGVMLMAGGFTV